MHANMIMLLQHIFSHFNFLIYFVCSLALIYIMTKMTQVKVLNNEEMFKKK